MTVWNLQHSVIADVPRSLAWAWWANVDNWRQHEGDAVESITLDGPFETGTRAVTKQRDQPPRPWRLSEVHAPERAVIEMELAGALLGFAWRFEDLRDGRTRMTQHMSLDGPAAGQYAADLDAGFGPNIGPGMEKLALAMAEQERST